MLLVNYWRNIFLALVGFSTLSVAAPEPQFPYPITQFSCKGSSGKVIAQILLPLKISKCLSTGSHLCLVKRELLCLNAECFSWLVGTGVGDEGQESPYFNCLGPSKYMRQTDLSSLGPRLNDGTATITESDDECCRMCQSTTGWEPSLHGLTDCRINILS